MPKKKILLVDDEEDILTIMENRITSWGYELLTAQNGREAINILKKQNPDIMILDYLMPEMDGIKTLEKIRTFNTLIPVIMYTAYPDNRSLEGTERLGIFAYIPKSSVYSDTSSSLWATIKTIEKGLGG